jgi:DNA-binding transcriptional LysR family regulator
MQLTAAGQRLYRFAAPFFEGLPGVVRAVQSGDSSGTLIIHAAPLFVRHLLPRWIQRVRRAHPQGRIELVEMPQADVARLRDGSADMLVDFLPEWPEDVATQRVGTLRGFVVLPARHPLARRSRLTLAQLGEETFISYPSGGLAHDLQMRALAEHGIRPHNMLSASTAESILGFVEAELGFSLLAWIGDEAPRWPGVAAIPLQSPKIEFPVMAAWRKDMPEHALLDAALGCAPKA